MIFPFIELWASSSIAMFVVAAIWWFWEETAPIAEATGERGVKKSSAVNKSAVFRMLSPGISMAAYHLRSLPLSKLRIFLEDRLKNAGSPLGFVPDEFLAVVVICGMGASFLGGAVASFVLGKVAPGMVVGLIFGVAAPWMKLDEAVRRRVRVICRSLPETIDLIALSMKAGLDMPGAIAQVSKRVGSDDPISFELAHLLHKFSLGHSRKSALEQLAKRVPAPVVRQFVGAVVQADKQGTPLAMVLSVQATVMRTRRSQKAEQSAARAAVLILGPLMLIFACVFIVLIGPFIIKAVRGELF